MNVGIEVAQEVRGNLFQNGTKNGKGNDRETAIGNLFATVLIVIMTDIPTHATTKVFMFLHFIFRNILNDVTGIGLVTVIIPLNINYMVVGMF